MAAELRVLEDKHFWLDVFVVMTAIIVLGWRLMVKYRHYAMTIRLQLSTLSAPNC